MKNHALVRVRIALVNKLSKSGCFARKSRKLVSKKPWVLQGKCQINTGEHQIGLRLSLDAIWSILCSFDANNYDTCISMRMKPSLWSSTYSGQVSKTLKKNSF